MSTPNQPKKNFKEISTHDFVRVMENEDTQQKGLFALIDFQENEAICNFSAKTIFTEPNYLSIQVSNNKHISLFPEFLQYTNHSCDPNVFFDTSTMSLIAIKKIYAEDELCFFYPSTEIMMAEPFNCNCGAENCLQEIKGALLLSEAVLKCYQINEFVKQSILNSSQQ